jgi:Domain of unknown function (DUF5615)
MARLYSNENFPLAAVLHLRALGHDVLTSLEAGNANQSIADDAVLAFASVQQRAVVTLNRLHFLRLHRTQPQHHGIIVCSYDPDFQALANRIHAAIAAQGSFAGQLLRVNRP